MKIDVEGHEAQVLSGTTRDQWLTTDAIVEIGSEANAAQIYEQFKDMGVRLFSQRTGWQSVSCLDDMPTTYHEGLLFVTAKEGMPW